MKDLQAIKVGIVDNLNLDVECESSDDFSSESDNAAYTELPTEKVTRA
jgi:hypothetical protein